MRIGTFKTDWGWCGIALGEAGVCRVLIPGEADRAAVLKKLAREFPGARRLAPKNTDATTKAAVEALRRYFKGEAVDFGALALDLAGLTKFQRRVLTETQRIPRGQTATYGEIARRCGSPRAARAVGTALKRNPLPVIVPCHRVVAADGPGKFSAGGGTRTKLELLALERNAARCRKPG